MPSEFKKSISIQRKLDPPMIKIYSGGQKYKGEKGGSIRTQKPVKAPKPSGKEKKPSRKDKKREGEEKRNQVFIRKGLKAA